VKDKDPYERKLKFISRCFKGVPAYVNIEQPFESWTLQ